MIRFGLPSKGRLKKQVEKFFSERGLELVNAGMTREYLAEFKGEKKVQIILLAASCLLYTSPSPRDDGVSRMPSSA